MMMIHRGNAKANDACPLTDRLAKNPLLLDIRNVLGNLDQYKEGLRSYYFDVLLSVNACPSCGGRIRMSGQSQCECQCGKTFDPTLVFQKSACCNADLLKKTFHYACSCCHKTVPSRFIFDERIFDKAYFQQMMRQSRVRAKEKREVLRRFYLESRSGALTLLEEPDLSSIPDLFKDLDNFIHPEPGISDRYGYEPDSSFQMEKYREHILAVIGRCPIRFSDIQALAMDPRLDRIWRFTTLIFMQHSFEIELTQEGNDLYIRRAVP